MIVNNAVKELISLRPGDEIVIAILRSTLKVLLNIALL